MYKSLCCRQAPTISSSESPSLASRAGLAQISAARIVPMGKAHMVGNLQEAMSS